MLVVRLYLSIKRKVIKSHGTDEVDVSGLTVHDLLISGDPQTGVFGQHLHNLTINASYDRQCLLQLFTLNVLRL